MGLNSHALEARLAGVKLIFLMLFMVHLANLGLFYVVVGVAIEEPGVRATLATCGLLKFFECPLIWAQEYLL
jgi:hypothetical protein